MLEGEKQIPPSPCVVYRSRLGRVMYVEQVVWEIWEENGSLGGATHLAHVSTPQEAIRLCGLAEED